MTRPAEKRKAPRGATREAFEKSNPVDQEEVSHMTYSRSPEDASARPRGSVVQAMHLPDRTNERLLLEAYDVLRRIALGDLSGDAAREHAHATAARLDLMGVR